LNFLDDQGITLHHLGGQSLRPPSHALNSGANILAPLVAVENSVNYDPITEEVVLQALELVIAPAASPLMIMCNLGRHRTGTVVGICKARLRHKSRKSNPTWIGSALADTYPLCPLRVCLGCLSVHASAVRKLQRWNLASILEEYRR